MALKAGRVGVRPDQVDRYGRITIVDRIVAKSMNKLYGDVPFLKGKWYEVHVSSDGESYTIESELTGITTFSGGLRFGNRAINAFMVGIKTHAKEGSETTSAVNVSYYPASGDSQATIGIPSISRIFDMKIWVQVVDKDEF